MKPARLALPAAQRDGFGRVGRAVASAERD